MRRLARALSAATLIVGFVAAATATAGPPVAVAQQTRPNIIVVMTDDQRRDDANGATMPDLNQYVGAADGLGVKYLNGYSPDPLCCPARAGFLTGQYTHNHDVLSNGPAEGGGFDKYQDAYGSNNLAVWLQTAGYTNGFVGKFINMYGSDESAYPATFVPPGFDDWRAFVPPGIQDYNDYDVNVNGSLVHSTTYKTTYVRARVVERINAWAPSDDPFFIWASFNAPHQPATPQPMYDGTSTTGHSSSAAFNEAQVVDKPPWIEALPLLTQSQQDTILANRRERRETLFSVDDAVQTIRDTLVANGEMDDTLILFVSDNGLMQGEHRIRMGKKSVYEESSGIPLMMRWTHGPVVPGESTRLATLLDVTATAVDAADATAGHVLDGRSLLGPSAPPGSWVTSAVEHFVPFEAVDSADNCVTGCNPAYQAIRASHYIAIRNDGGPNEFYDLTVDPDQTLNRIGDSAYDDIRPSLFATLDQLDECGGDPVDGDLACQDVYWTPPN